MAKATAKASRLVKESALRVVDIEGVQFDPSYQRDVVAKHKKIVSGFNPQALGIPVFAEREDGSIWCVDGRQRITALATLGRKKVRAEVFASKGPEHEAEVFRLINANRTKLRPIELFHASLTAGEAVAWDIKQIIEKHGFVIPASGTSGRTSGEKAATTIGCVNTLRRAYTVGGSAVVNFVLGVVKAIWPGDPLRTTADVCGGLTAFYMRHNMVVDVDRLVPRLNATTAAKLIYSAALGVGGRDANTADTIERIYRKRKAG